METMDIREVIPHQSTFQREEIIETLNNYRFISKESIPGDNLTLEKIKNVVEFVFNADLFLDTRKRTKVNALKAFCYLAKEYTNLTYGIIGEYVKRDHATVIHHTNPANIYSCQSIMETDKEFRKRVEECIAILSDHQKPTEALSDAHSQSPHTAKHADN